jgi:hypothetical protein
MALAMVPRILEPALSEKTVIPKLALKSFDPNTPFDGNVLTNAVNAE